MAARRLLAPTPSFSPSAKSVLSSRSKPKTICESYFEAVKTLPPSQIETIDMARRGIHNEGARVLQERLQGKAEVDNDTARRLFTLICVLHFGG